MDITLASPKASFSPHRLRYLSILMRVIIKLSLLVCFPIRAASKLYTQPSQLPVKEYDFIVVGAGTAGNVVATRLTENPSYSVLLIEAGGSNEGIVPMEVPFIAGSLLSNLSLVWNYTTLPQTSLNNRMLPYQRGRVLGGSSSVNSLIWTRGSRDDFDRFAKVTNDPNWSWDAMFPYMLKLEKFTPPVDKHDTKKQFNPKVHGFHGNILTTLPGFPTAIDPRAIATTQVDPKTFPFNLDSNSGNTIGISWTQSTSGNGIRSSSATGYLEPVINRPNLHVLVNTQVTKLINVAKGDGKPDLREVELAQNSTGKRLIVKALKEVILSAGPVNSPQLLMLSGVGPRATLSKFGIKTLVNSPGVGQNLQDHPGFANPWQVDSNDTLDSIARDPTVAEGLLDQWLTNHTGQFTDVGGNTFAWLRNSSIFKNGNTPDPSAGPTSAHIEIFTGNLFASFITTSPPTGNFITPVLALTSPASRGSITLQSPNPFIPPLINPAFLADPADMAMMVQAFKLSKYMLSLSPWQDLKPRPFGALGHATTDAQIEAVIRNTITTFWHTSCTAKMGRSTDPMAVLDSKLNVKGVTGLRVVDASIFPFIPAAHLQAPVYAIAERAVDIIKNSWK